MLAKLTLRPRAAALSLAAMLALLAASACAGTVSGLPDAGGPGVGDAGGVPSADTGVPASPDAGADASGPDIPLQSILINGAHGTSTTLPNSVTNTVEYTPSDATDKSLVWTVCTAQPVACNPDDSGHCRTCSPAGDRGSVTNDGVYTPPSSISGDSTEIFLTACHGSGPSAICDWTIVTVYAANGAPVISSFAASPAVVSAGQPSTLSWTVSGATSLSINNGVGDVTGLTSASVSPASTTTYTLTAINASGSRTATAMVTVSGGGSGTRYGTGGSVAPTFVTTVTGGGAAPNAAEGVSVLDYGAVGNGSHDDTSAFQSAADAARDQGKPLVVPATSSYYVLSGSVTVYGSVTGAGYPEIRQTGADGDSGHIMFRVSYQGPGMWITGLHLEGGFAEDGQDIPSGEWSHGVSLSDAHNVTIRDNLIANMKGDSIYLGTGGSGQNQNILIDSNSLINSYRCNIAFIDSDGVVVTNNVIVKRNTYVFGLDFEPNDPSTEADWNAEVAGNDCTIPDARCPSGLSQSDDWMANATHGTGHGGNLYLHDNFGHFGTSDRGTGDGPGFWSDNNDPGSVWSNIVVTNNVSTR